VRVVLEEPGPAVDGALPVTVPQEGADEAAGQLLGHLEQRHHRPGAGRAFDPQVVAVVPVVLEQGPDQQQVDRDQTGPRQLELPPNMPVVDSAGSYWTEYSPPATLTA
jgi:hypothetical protein